MKKRKAVWLLLLMFSVACVQADPLPSLDLGTSAGMLSSSAESSGIELDYYVRADFSAGVRNAIGTSGLLLASSRVRLDVFDSGLMDDLEIVDIEIDVGRVTLGAGLLSSLFGDGTIYLNPDWRLSADMGREGAALGLTLGYDGYLVYTPDSAEDLIFQGLGFEGRYDPSFYSGFGWQAGIGWQNYFEQPVFATDGSETGASRNDLIADASISADGLIGYFSGWQTSVGGSIRFSNAAYFIEASEFLARPEDRALMQIDASVFTSPHQSINIEAGVGIEATWYLSRPVGIETPDLLRIFGASGSLDLDWTPNGKFFVTVESGGNYILSNDPAIGGWSFDAGVGVLLSF